MGRAGWSVVVPLRLRGSKSRLTHLPGGAPLDQRQREGLAAAMALDTLTAVLACSRVRRVLAVVDPAAGRLLSTLDLPPAASGAAPAAAVRLVPDAGTGHDGAVLAGAAAAHEVDPGAPVAVLPADLPALDADALREALATAAAWPRACVADLGGEGTVLLAAAPGVALLPSFGPGSAGRHRESGAVLLDGCSPRLRRDVDTAEHLRDAAALGLGPRTATLLGRLTPDAQPAAEHRSR